MYWRACGRSVGVHHMLPETLLLPPSHSFFIFSRITTLAPASAAVMAAASPACPVPTTTTSTTLSHLAGTAAAWADAGAAEPATPPAATAAPAAADPFRNSRRPTLLECLLTGALPLVIARLPRCGRRPWRT